MDEKIKLAVKFNRARFNLLFMIILSAINFYFLLSSERFYLPFSSSLSSYSLVLGVRAANDLGEIAFRTVGIIFACVVLLVYIYCYLRSKSNPFFLFMSFTIFIADTIALVILTIVIQSYSILSFLDIGLHLMTIYFLYSGIKSERHLTKLVKETYDPANDEEISRENADDENEPLLYGNYNNVIVKVKETDSIISLIINGGVCKALKTADLSDFELHSIVDEVAFVCVCKRSESGLVMSLYADDILLDSCIKNI